MDGGSQTDDKAQAQAASQQSQPQKQQQTQQQQQQQPQPQQREHQYLQPQQQLQGLLPQDQGVNVSAFPSMIPQMYANAPLQQNFDGNGGYDQGNGYDPQAQYTDGQYATYYQGQTGVYQDWGQQSGDAGVDAGQTYDPQNQAYYAQSQDNNMDYMSMQYGQSSYGQGVSQGSQPAFYAQQFQTDYQARPDQQNAFDGGVSLFPPMTSQFMPQSYAHIFPSTLPTAAPAPVSAPAVVSTGGVVAGDGKVEGQMPVTGDPQVQQQPEFQATEFPGNLYSLNNAFSQMGFAGSELPQAYPAQLAPQLQQPLQGQVVQGIMPGPFTATALPQAQVIAEVVSQEPTPAKPLSYADALTRPRVPGQPVPAVRYQARPQTVRAPPAQRGGAAAARRVGATGRGGAAAAAARGGAAAGQQAGARRAPANYSGANRTVNGNTRPQAPHPKQAIYGIKDSVKLDLNIRRARFFVIKSFSADDIHKSIKYKVWSSTKHGNRRLDDAFRESREVGKECPVYLFFSVNSSGCFCGLAEMTSAVDYSKSFSGWGQQEKWSGQFAVDWIYVKNIPNKKLRHIRLANNDGKPFTNSRDTQEVFLEQGKEVLRIFQTVERAYSILDDFDHFDKEEEQKKIMAPKKGAAKSTAAGSANSATTKAAANGNAAAAKSTAESSKGKSAESEKSSSSKSTTDR
eukprot:g3274.t1